MSYELGDFSFSYRSLAVHGFGLSASSNFAVLYEAIQLYLKHGLPVRLDDVAREALEFERRASRGLAVAADDVYPIVHGGVLKVHTVPVPEGAAQSGVTVEVVPHDPVWIAEHVVVAFNRFGKRHNVPDLLEHLFKHEGARGFVREISDQALAAAAAISSGDASALAESVRQYRKTFSIWTKGEYINKTVGKLGAELDKLQGNVLAWKPPGAGASEAIVVITPDKEARDKVLAFFEKDWKDWWCKPAYVSTGLCGEFIKSDGKVRVTAGHRIDFVGAADLGQAELIGEPGICCSCAIEPRSEIELGGSSQARQPGPFTRDQVDE